MAVVFCKAVSAVASTLCREENLLLLLGHFATMRSMRSELRIVKARMNEWAYATVPYTPETMSMVQRVK